MNKKHVGEMRDLMDTPEMDDPDLPLSQLFALWPDTASVFFSGRLACVGCPIAPFHTVIDACIEYGLDETAFRAKLRTAVQS